MEVNVNVAKSTVARPSQELSRVASSKLSAEEYESLTQLTRQLYTSRRIRRLSISEALRFLLRERLTLEKTGVRHSVPIAGPRGQRKSDKVAASTPSAKIDKPENTAIYQSIPAPSDEHAEPIEIHQNLPKEGQRLPSENRREMPSLDQSTTCQGPRMLTEQILKELNDRCEIMIVVPRYKPDLQLSLYREILQILAQEELPRQFYLGAVITTPTRNGKRVIEIEAVEAFK